MSVLVVDASFALKWLIDEGDRDAATALALSHQLSAPDIIDIEVWSGLWWHTQRRKISHRKIEELFQAYLGVPIARQPFQTLMNRARVLSLQLDASLFDCLYWAELERIGGKLATGDLKFVAKLREGRLLSSKVILF